MVNKLNILVTGGSGFIGSHVVDLLLNQGYHVRCLDNFSTGDISNIMTHLEHPRFTLAEVDVTKKRRVDEVMPGTDIVIHLAGIPSVMYNKENPVKTFENNVNGTLNVIESAVENDVERIIFASSSSVYGDNNQNVITEKTKCNPKSLYALGKRMCEKLGKLATENHNISFTSMRFFNVFGERQSTWQKYPAVIPAWLTAIKKGENPVIYGIGNQIRTLTPVKNIAKGICLSIGECSVYEEFNLCADSYVTVNELFAIVKSVTKTDLNPDFKKAREEDILISMGSPEKAKTKFGFNPEIDLRGEIAKIWHSMQEH